MRDQYIIYEASKQAKNNMGYIVVPSSTSVLVVGARAAASTKFVVSKLSTSSPSSPLKRKETEIGHQEIHKPDIQAMKQKPSRFFQLPNALNGFNSRVKTHPKQCVCMSWLFNSRYTDV